MEEDLNIFSTKAQDMSESYGISITENDIVDFITSYPEGRESYEKVAKIKELSDKFKEMVGFSLNYNLAFNLLDLVAEKHEVLSDEECPF
jgi:hypothetical protein